MISRTIFCSAQASVIAWRDGADARHLAQAVGLGLDNIEHLLPERLDHLLGVDRPDAADHPRAEIFLELWKVTRSTRPARTSCSSMIAVLASWERQDRLFSLRAPLPRMPRGRSTARGGLASDTCASGLDVVARFGRRRTSIVNEGTVHLNVILDNCSPFGQFVSAKTTLPRRPWEAKRNKAIRDSRGNQRARIRRRALHLAEDGIEAARPSLHFSWRKNLK